MGFNWASLPQAKRQTIHYRRATGNAVGGNQSSNDVLATCRQTSKHVTDPDG
jgi:hypothetical protein